MRVYRDFHALPIPAVSSLTIREGISSLKANFCKVWKFPHYTWGYIGSYGTKDLTLIVPSLYVRVYRLLWVFLHSSCSSLTIREGISLKAFYPKHSRTFPHYTWGYIVQHLRRNFILNVPSLYVRVYRFRQSALACLNVPSLYVRVYRSFVVLSALWLCSLTIREGISITSQISLHHIWFPHYTWGYIVDELEQELSGDVPSLYVRVYRNAVNDWQQERGSLTIREGISTGKKTLYQA